MAWSRRKEEYPDQDAELRQLVNEYAKTHNPKSENVKEATPKETRKTIAVPSSTESAESFLGMPTEDLINGRSFSYTPAEARLYADVEPCDTWRHFDEWFRHHLPLHMGSDYYRYGVRRSPVPYWQELRFCISTKSMTPLEAKIAIGRRKAEKLARLRQQGSSEDFWEIRKEPLRNPFPLAGKKLTSEDKAKSLV